MQLTTQVIFITSTVKKEFEGLQGGKSEDRERYNQLQEVFILLEKNGFSGIQIKKRLIPKKYLSEFKIHNLWKYNLPDGWRLLYAIENQGNGVFVIIIEWLSHKDYERKFNY